MRKCDNKSFTLRLVELKDRRGLNCWRWGSVAARPGMPISKPFWGEDNKFLFDEVIGFLLHAAEHHL